MKISVLLLMIAILYNSCCKCDIPRNWEGFRFVDSTGKDLVYGGPVPFYNRDSIRFYCTNCGNDSVLASHSFGISATPPDTVTAVAFRQGGKDTNFVYFGQGDIDTLILKYNNIAGGCCDDVFEIVPFLYNGDSIVREKGWIKITK